MTSRFHSTVFAAAALLIAGCALFQEDKSYNPVIDPARFVKTVDNPYFPLVPGTTQRYINTSDEGKRENVVTVTASTKVILGVTCTVVHDVLSEGSKLLEDTWDWYAQDSDGSVWYFGEDTKEYEHGRVSTEGSWEAGVNGAKPGIVMPAKPKVGEIFRQEYLVGTAEDQAQILALGEEVSTPAGKFSNCVKTQDWTRLEPGVMEHKYFAPGVGVVLEVMVEGGVERQELIGK